jgi:hypothetical protein
MSCRDDYERVGMAREFEAMFDGQINRHRQYAQVEILL